MLANLRQVDARRTTAPVRRRVRSRGVPPALEDHELLYTGDAHEAAERISATFGPARLQLAAGAEAGFAASLHGARLRDVSLLHLDLHVPCLLELASTGPYVSVHMPTNGAALVQIADETVEINPIRALVTSPHTRLSIRFEDDAPHLILRFALDRFETVLARLVGRSLHQPVAFSPVLDLTTDEAARWNGAVQLLHTEVLHSESLVRQGLGITPLEEFLMSTLLLLQPSNYRRWITRPAERPGRRVVNRAVEYIETHLTEEVTVNDLARHVGMSVRTLQDGFRQELGVSPMTYLRDRRLERAREQLADAVPADGVTVADVAGTWGFTHLSNFSGFYRKRFGESPSQTLRR